MPPDTWVMALPETDTCVPSALSMVPLSPRLWPPSSSACISALMESCPPFSSSLPAMPSIVISQLPALIVSFDLPSRLTSPFWQSMESWFWPFLSARVMSCFPSSRARRSPPGVTASTEALPCASERVRSTPPLVLNLRVVFFFSKLSLFICAVAGKRLPSTTGRLKSVPMNPTSTMSPTSGTR